jgi:hypothetical protein
MVSNLVLPSAKADGALTSHEWYLAMLVPGCYCPEPRGHTKLDTRDVRRQPLLLDLVAP